MPGFFLPDVVEERTVASTSLVGASGTLVVFLCRHCPYVVRIRGELAAIAREYTGRGIRIVAISSNDSVAYPEDSSEKLREMAEELQWDFPLLFDESQEVARAFGAVCTPDIFLFDADLLLHYHGRLDDSTPGNGQPVTGRDLRSALEAMLAGLPPSGDCLPSIGCSIKWRRRD